MSEQIKTAGKVLAAKGIVKNYGKQQVLSGLDLELQPGCIYGLIGRNGVGKTTLLGILTGQNTHDAGTVTYGGQPVWENPEALADICFSRELVGGAANQGRAALKVKDYLRAGALFFPHWDAVYADRLVKLFKLDGKKQIAKLSKGQASMVTVVLALASRAPITLLDEPVAGMDVVAREQFYRLLLDDYAETGRTFVISTHIIEEAAGVFERVVILDDGRVIEDCPTDELVAQFRYISGEETALADAVRTAGVQVLSAQSLGRHRLLAVRGTAAQFAALEAAGLAVDLMSLQNLFVALCGHGDERAEG